MNGHDKRISEYISALQEAGLLVSADFSSDCKISGVSFNSKDVTDGTLFVCKGVHFKPEYLDEAISKGAVAYVSTHTFDVNPSIAAIRVSDIRKSMPVVSKTYYGDLSREIDIIGITGTKGKSTTCYFVRSIFDDWLTEKYGVKSAFCSGIDNYDGKTLEESHLTTPEIPDLYRHLDNAQQSGIPVMEMEVSSQGLKYDRVSGIRFKVACFLNIGDDHISDMEHKGFDDYFGSKLLIFDQADNACINMDSDEFETIKDRAAVTGNVVTFSESDHSANVYSENIASDSGKVQFDVCIQNVAGYEDTKAHIVLAAFGVINIKDALAAISIAAVMGVPLKFIQSGLAKALVPGRMEVHYSPDRRYIGIVDYAHNELSYNALLSAISGEFPDKKIVMVFGSSGGKANNRREKLGSIAGKYCSHVILTEDDGGEEDVAAICEEITRYLGPLCTYEIIIDRPEAIRKAVRDADEKTIVIAAGKGREHYQKRGDHYVDIESDVDVMSEALSDKN